jgi:type IV pilus assembly protein PilW
MSLFQGGRNTLTGGTSAQENGLFGMQLVATDIRSTGAGYYSTATQSSASLQSCTNVCSFYGSGSGTGGCSGNGTPTGSNRIASISGDALTGAGYQLKVPLFPVIIEHWPPSANATATAAIPYASGSDIITVRSASRFIGSIPTQLSAGVNDMGANPSANLAVNRTFGFGYDYLPTYDTSHTKVNDLALIADGSGNCTVFEITGVDATGPTLSHASSSFNPSSGFDWPPDTNAAGQPIPNGKSYGNDAMVYNLGDNYSGSTQGTRAPGVVVAREYSIAGPSGTSMQMRQIGAATPTSADIPLAMADGIVALKAQYGIATTANDGTASTCANTPAVVAWVGTDDTTNWNNIWKPGALDSAHAACVRAVRILVVARSGNREATTVTDACTTNGFAGGPCPSGGTTEADPTLPAINFTGLPWALNNDWQHYRYKTYLTVVPIRNILWNGAWNYTNSGGTTTYTGQ